jgi:hypothetical protein
LAQERSSVPAKLYKYLKNPLILQLSEEELQSIQDLANACVANIQAIATELLTDITSIVTLLNEILQHLTNPIQLVTDIFQLRAALTKIIVSSTVIN